MNLDLNGEKPDLLLWITGALQGSEPPTGGKQPEEGLYIIILNSSSFL